MNRFLFFIVLSSLAANSSTIEQIAGNAINRLSGVKDAVLEDLKDYVERRLNALEIRWLTEKGKSMNPVFVRQRLTEQHFQYMHFYLICPEALVYVSMYLQLPETFQEDRRIINLLIARSEKTYRMTPLLGFSKVRLDFLEELDSLGVENFFRRWIMKKRFYPSPDFFARHPVFKDLREELKKYIQSKDQSRDVKTKT